MLARASASLRRPSPQPARRAFFRMLIQVGPLRHPRWGICRRDPGWQQRFALACQPTRALPHSHSAWRGARGLFVHRALLNRMPIVALGLRHRACVRRRAMPFWGTLGGAGARLPLQRIRAARARACRVRRRNTASHSRAHSCTGARANTAMWTHWGLNPGPSACGADVIPLHHVPRRGCCSALHWACS